MVVGGGCAYPGLSFFSFWGLVALLGVGGVFFWFWWVFMWGGPGHVCSFGRVWGFLGGFGGFWGGGWLFVDLWGSLLRGSVSLGVGGLGGVGFLYFGLGDCFLAFLGVGCWVVFWGGARLGVVVGYWVLFGLLCGLILWWGSPGARGGAGPRAVAVGGGDGK